MCESPAVGDRVDSTGVAGFVSATVSLSSSESGFSVGVEVSEVAEGEGFLTVRASTRARMGLSVEGTNFLQLGVIERIRVSGGVYCIESKPTYPPLLRMNKAFRSRHVNPSIAAGEGLTRSIATRELVSLF